MMLAAFSLGVWEIGAIVLVGLLLFGSRLPSIARSVGKSITEFKKGVKDVHEEAVAEKPRLEEKRTVEAQKTAEVPAEKVSS